MLFYFFALVDAQTNDIQHGNNANINIGYIQSQLECWLEGVKIYRTNYNK